MSGIAIPWLEYSMMVLGVLLLLIPGWSYVRRISQKIHKKDWVTCDKCGLIGVRNIKARELEEMEDNQRKTGQTEKLRINSLGDIEPQHEKVPECIMQAQDFAAIPFLSTHPSPLFHMQFPRQCQYFMPWQKGFTPKEHHEKIGK